jgi:hypothetical protein
MLHVYSEFAHIVAPECSTVWGKIARTLASIGQRALFRRTSGLAWDEVAGQIVQQNKK